MNGIGTWMEFTKQASWGCVGTKIKIMICLDKVAAFYPNNNGTIQVDVSGSGSYDLDISYDEFVKIIETLAGK